MTTWNMLNRWREVKERSEKELWRALSGNLLKKVPITCHCSTNAPKPTRLLDLFFLQNISFEIEPALQNFTYCMNGSRSVPLFQFFPCLELFGNRSLKTLRKISSKGEVLRRRTKWGTVDLATCWRLHRGWRWGILPDTGWKTWFLLSGTSLFHCW